ncbi:MAG: ROK family protein [Bacillus sp. (in: firmicutes)]
MKNEPIAMSQAIMKGIRSSLIELRSVTKPELSEKLGISFPTISKFLDQMQAEGELLSTGLDRSSGGRRAIRYTYNPDYMMGLAIFLEKKETKYAVFNCFGEVKEEGTVASALMDEDLRVLTACLEDQLVKYPKINGIAIGVPGSVKDGRIFYIPGYEQLQNMELKEYLENRFSMPVVIENDMNAAVLGFNDRQIESKNRSLVYLYSGQNGPGAGIMVNGVVVRGSTHFSGEISFVPQYDGLNFGQALEGNDAFGEQQYDAIGRLVSAFAAIINPHMFILCESEITKQGLDVIKKRSAKYIPAEHLPEFTSSDWEQDYLSGLQRLCLECMIRELSK